MDKDWLTQQLTAGRSIADIADEVDRDHSTVSYWVRKHGLRSQYSDRHSPRGRLDRAVLIEHLEAGRSTREIAEALDRSQATVRHWLKRYDLKTTRSAGRPSVPRIVDDCHEHGPSTFVFRKGTYVCAKCRAGAVTRWRQKAKRILVEEAGGSCVVCGYDRSIAALHFHHLDRAQKRFGLGSRGLARSIESLREEAAKCVLLCANCHTEVEAGIATLPDAPGRPPE